MVWTLLLSVPRSAPGAEGVCIDALAERCLRLAHALGLAVAGIDLKLTPDQQVYCFEVNPSPAFSYYEAHTGQPIAQAIARYLAAEARARA